MRENNAVTDFLFLKEQKNGIQVKMEDKRFLHMTSLIVFKIV